MSGQPYLIVAELLPVDGEVEFLEIKFYSVATVETGVAEQKRTAQLDGPYSVPLGRFGVTLHLHSISE